MTSIISIELIKATINKHRPTAHTHDELVKLVVSETGASVADVVEIIEQIGWVKP
jgi:hypothetical protein